MSMNASQTARIARLILEPPLKRQGESGDGEGTARSKEKDFSHSRRSREDEPWPATLLVAEYIGVSHQQVAQLKPNRFPLSLADSIRPR